MTSESPIRIAFLISGRGSNMGAIAQSDELRSRAAFVGVVSSRENAEGLERARTLGIETQALERRRFPDTASWEAAIENTLEHWGAELVVLAGWMRILSDDFVGRWRGRMINIHPSLLPAFPGLHPQKQALEYGVKVTGATVHFVVPGPVDGGPIVAQCAVPVHEGDDEERLSARILREEHRLYPQAVAAVLDDLSRS